VHTQSFVQGKNSAQIGNNPINGGVLAGAEAFRGLSERKQTQSLEQGTMVRQNGRGNGFLGQPLWLIGQGWLQPCVWQIWPHRQGSASGLIGLNSEIWLETGEVKLERKIAKLKKIVGTSMLEFDAADNIWPGNN